MKDDSAGYNDLIDVCLRLEDDPALTGKVKDQFIWIIREYFFQEEKSAGKNIELVINNLPPPQFLSTGAGIFDINLDDLKKYIMGSSFNDSLAGRIMLSQPYLKVFYQNHPPAFTKLPEDVRFELMDAIKEKNAAVVAAFEKMFADRSADKQRKILTLIALILKNIHQRTEAPFNKLQKPAEEIIRSIFLNTDEVFAASQKQVADLNDDTKIRQLIKSFFTIKQFREISTITSMFKEEIEQFRKRTASAKK